MDFTISKDIMKNVPKEMLALFCPPLAAFYNITTDLGSYSSKVKFERQNYCVENFINLIRDIKTKEEFINEISEGKLESIFMDFLETALRKVSLIDSESKKRRFAYLLNNAYRFQINSLLYERLLLSKDKNKVLELSLEGKVIRTPKDIFTANNEKPRICILD